MENKNKENKENKENQQKSKMTTKIRFRPTFMSLYKLSQIKRDILALLNHHLVSIPLLSNVVLFSLLEFET
jgi:hypothetical protein